MRRHSIATILAPALLAFSAALAPTASAADSPVPDDATQWGSIVIGDRSASSTAALTDTGAAPSWVVGSSTVGVAGGTWSYGTNSTIVWSRYLHPTRYHGSSVTTYDGGIIVRSAVTLPGRWSNAQVRRSPSQNEAYYWLS